MTTRAGVSAALVSQLDLLASLAALVGEAVPGGDGQNLLPALLGEGDTGRDQLVLEATSRTALRRGRWLMIPPYAGPPVNTQVDIELGNQPGFQLYDLRKDIGQQHNLAESLPDTLRQLISTYTQIRGGDLGKYEELKLE